MKNIFKFLIVFFLVAGTASAQESRATAIKNLMGLGMPGQLATEVAGLTAGNAIWDQDIKYSTAAMDVSANTADAADSDVICINGGGAQGSTRGGSVCINGNENAGLGAIEILGGNTTSGNVAIRLSNASAAFQVKQGASEYFAMSGAGALRQLPYVPTFAATPAEGTNDIKRYSVFPTAAANAAAGLPGVPTPGDSYMFCNEGPNAVRVKAYGTPGINGAAAGTYLAVATKQCGRCTASDTGLNYDCSLSTVPTPAGP